MRKTGSALMAALLLAIWTAGCGQAQADPAQDTEGDNPQEEIVTDTSDVIRLDSEIIELENGFEAVKFEGNDGFEEFLSQGGAASDSEVVRFLTENLIAGTELDYKTGSRKRRGRNGFEFGFNPYFGGIVCPVGRHE